jgi:hypothetical protein
MGEVGHMKRRAFLIPDVVEQIKDMGGIPGTPLSRYLRDSAMTPLATERF